MSNLLRRLGARLRYRHFDREVADELVFHRAMKERELQAAGLTPDEARAAAGRGMGNELMAREGAREVWIAPALDTLAQDVRYAWRGLRRDRAFSVAAILTLALGIGATTAIFSVVNAALLKPLPYPEGHRILALSYPDGGAQDGQTFHYVRARARSFERVAAHSDSAGWNVVAGNRAEYATGLPVSQEFFAVLGVAPRLGREFAPDEDRPGGTRAVILGDGLWRRMFDARNDAVGQTVLLGGIPHVVVGVMPAGFMSIPGADLWTPLRVSAQDNSWNYTVLGRLAASLGPEQASVELDTFRNALHRELNGISENRSRGLLWVAYQRQLNRGSHDAMLLLLGAVGFLLLIACVNVASLQIVRALSRRREIATRAALGGGTRRLVQQMLTESVFLSLIGAVAGLLATGYGIRALATMVPAEFLSTQAIDVDWRVLTATLGVAVMTGVLFGLAPAAAVARVDVRSALWESSRHTAGRRTIWLRRMFNVVEVALAVMLLVAAGLLIRTFVTLRSAELGFDPSNVFVGTMSLQGSPEQSSERLERFLERTLSRIRALPGVTAAAVANNVPVERCLNLPIEPPLGAQVHEMRAVDWRYVTPQYFEVFRIPIRTGRAFEESDTAASAPVALVNEAFARTYFGAWPATGRAVQLARSLNDPARVVVGVVADAKGVSGSGWISGMGALGSPAAPTIYVPVAQVPDQLLQMVHNYFPVSWSVRTRDAAPHLVPAIQDIVRSTAPGLPFIGFKTMDDVVARDVETQRFLTSLLTLFAAVALVLAAVGMYGLVAYTASQRSREIAIRMALGANRLRVLRGFLSEGVVLTLVGLAAGLAGAVPATRAIASLIYGVDRLDPLTFCAVAAVLLLVAAFASLLPASRAARTDPMLALRGE